MTGNRQLDNGNAHPGSLGADFSLLGMALWDALKTAHPRATAWNNDLSALNEARNAIAHAEEGRLVSSPRWIRTSQQAVEQIVGQPISPHRDDRLKISPIRPPEL
jgi:hypothetical protein